MASVRKSHNFPRITVGAVNESSVAKPSALTDENNTIFENYSPRSTSYQLQEPKPAPPPATEAQDAVMEDGSVSSQKAAQKAALQRLEEYKAREAELARRKENATKQIQGFTQEDVNHLMMGYRDKVMAKMTNILMVTSAVGFLVGYGCGWWTFSSAPTVTEAVSAAAKSTAKAAARGAARVAKAAI